MQIINSTEQDVETIFKFYDDAIAYQKIKFNKHWQGFDIGLIKTEIQEKRQYKIVVDDVVVCVFAVTFNDFIIWGDKDKDPSIYLHRIVTKPGFRGNGYVKNIIDWAVNYGKENGKQFVRLDTWGDNQKLIEYYTNCGFNFLGLTGEIVSADLPKHYQSLYLSLFEIAIEEYQPAV